MNNLMIDGFPDSLASSNAWRKLGSGLYLGLHK